MESLCLSPPHVPKQCTMTFVQMGHLENLPGYQDVGQNKYDECWVCTSLGLRCSQYHKSLMTISPALPEHPPCFPAYSIHIRCWQKIVVTQRTLDKEWWYCPEWGIVTCYSRIFLVLHTVRDSAWMSHSMHTCLVAFGRTEKCITPT